MMEYPTMWTCEVTVLRLELYLHGKLARADALAVAEHLEACISCNQRLMLLQGEVRPAENRG
jgi:predicted anti-sigma-YlaC factor YlaD